jgi:hypothetical protein
MSVIERKTKSYLIEIKQNYKKTFTCPLGLASQLSLNDNDGLPSSIYYPQKES